MHQLHSTCYATEQKSVPVWFVCAFMCFHICGPKHKTIVHSLGFLMGAAVSQGAVWIAASGSQGGNLLEGSKPVLEAAAVVVAYGRQD